MTSVNAIVGERPSVTREQSSDSKVEERRWIFDWLRLGLSLSVVIAHVVNLTGGKVPHLPNMVGGFLAISGYLILQSFDRDPSVGRFWWKRLLRIGPALVASFTLVLVLFGLKGLGGALTQYITVGLVPAGEFNSPLWSLGCEEVMYALLCLLYLAGAYKVKGAIWAAWTVGVALAFYGQHMADPKLIRIVELPLAFFSGNLVYLYQQEIVRRAKLFAWLGGVAVVVAFAELVYMRRFNIDWNAHKSVLLWAACVAGYAILGITTQTKVKIKTDLSYGIYVYHWPLLVALQKLAHFEGWKLWLVFPLAFIVAWLSAKFIEQPALRWKNQFAKARPATDVA